MKEKKNPGVVAIVFGIGAGLLLFALIESNALAQDEIEPNPTGLATPAIPAGPQPTATVTPLQATPVPTATVTPLPSASPSDTQPQTTNTVTPSPTPSASATRPETTNTVTPSPTSTP